MMMVAQKEIKPVELELMAFSFIQFSFSVCVRVIGKKTKQKKSIGFKRSERTNGRHKIFKKDFVCCFVCFVFFSHFLGLVFCLLSRVFPQLTVVQKWPKYSKDGKERLNISFYRKLETKNNKKKQNKPNERINKYKRATFSSMSANFWLLFLLFV